MMELINEKHRIVVEDVSGKRKGILICYGGAADVITINRGAAGMEQIAELMAIYLDLASRDRFEVRNHVDDTSIKEILRVLDRVDRIRRKLYRARG